MHNKLAAPPVAKLWTLIWNAGRAAHPASFWLACTTGMAAEADGTVERMRFYFRLAMSSPLQHGAAADMSNAN